MTLVRCNRISCAKCHEGICSQKVIDINTQLKCRGDDKQIIKRGYDLAPHEIYIDTHCVHCQIFYENTSIKDIEKCMASIVNIKNCIIIRSYR